MFHHGAVDEHVAAADTSQQDAALSQIRWTRRPLQIQRQQPLQHLLIAEIICRDAHLAKRGNSAKSACERRGIPVLSVLESVILSDTPSMCMSADDVESR